MVHDRGMGNVLSVRVHSHDEEHGLSNLAMTDGEGNDVSGAPHLIAPRIVADVGSRVTIAFSPRDVALAHGEVRGISIQNQLSGTVSRCTNHERSALVEVHVGQPILAQLSRPSAASLDLKPGRPVVCLIKSHAIRFVGVRASEGGRTVRR